MLKGFRLITFELLAISSSLYNPHMKLSNDRVEQVAKLASLELNNDEISKYGEQLSAILDYVEQIEAVDTAGIVPIFNVSGKKSVMRKDVVVPSLSQTEATMNGKNVNDGLFVAKGVFEEE